MQKMDLPEFLMHGNLYHAQQLVMYSEGKLKTRPVWKTSLRDFAGRMLVKNKLHDPVVKTIDQMVKGYTVQYPGTRHTVTEHVFDTWWDVIFGDECRMPWQTKPDAVVRNQLDQLRKDSRLTLVRK
jgi:hypothetical protein